MDAEQDGPAVGRAGELLDDAYDLREAGSARDALAICDEAEVVLARAGVDQSAAVALRLLNERAVCLSDVGDPEGERKLLDRVLTLAADNDNPDVAFERRVAVGNLALVHLKEGRHEEVLRLLQGDFIEWWPEPDEVWGAPLFLRGARLWAHALVGIGVPERAIEMLDLITAQYGASVEAGLRYEVTRCYEVKAYICANVGNHDAAIGAYDTQLQRLADADDAESVRAAAAAWVYRAYSREMTGDTEAANADRRAFLDRFADYDDQEVDRLRNVARAVFTGPPVEVGSDRHQATVRAAAELLDEALRLRDTGSAREALGKCQAADDILTQGGATSTAVALRCLNERALCLGDLGDADSAADALTEVLQRAADRTDPPAAYQRRVAAANLALLHLQAGRHADVIRVLQGDFIEWWPEADEIPASWVFVRGMRSFAFALAGVELRELAIEILDDVIAEYEGSVDEDTQADVARCLQVKADVCADLGDYLVAIATYDRRLAELGEPADAAAAGEAIEAWVLRAQCREMHGDVEGAQADRQEAVRRFAEFDNEKVRAFRELLLTRE